MVRGQSGNRDDVPESQHHNPFTIQRGIIPLPALDASYMINKETGYIRINKFSRTTFEEFMTALEALEKAGT